MVRLFDLSFARVCSPLGRVALLASLLPGPLGCGGPPGPAASAPAAATASSAPASSSPLLPLDPRITSGSLGNGFSYYLQQHRVEDHRAQLALVVKVGSVYEQEDQRGLAHFIEHMAFQGTRRFSRQELGEFFEKSGMKFGAHVSAFTSYDRMQYQLSVPTDDPVLLLTALDVLEDWASSLSFQADAVQSERQVLLSEWTRSHAAEPRMEEQQRQLLLAGSRYAERDVLGEQAVLEGVSRERLIEFYQRWYRPERMAVVVVGDIDPSLLQPAIEGRFAQRSTVAAPSSERFSIPVQAGASAAVITDPELSVSTADVVFKVAARPVIRQADFRAQLISAMISLMLSRRLDELSDNPLAPFTGASSSLAPNVLGRLDLLQLSAQAKPGQVQKSLEVLLEEVQRVRLHGFVATELRRTKAQYARFLDQAAASQDTVETGAISGALANHFITGNSVTAADLQKKLGSSLLREIALGEVNAAAVAWFTGSEELLWVNGATRAGLPEKASLLAARDAARQQRPAAYLDQVAPASLLPTPPTPGTIVKEEHIAEIDVTVWTLSNGARVVLKPTDFQQDQILEQSVSWGGNARVSAADYPSARVAHEVVAASGLGSLDRRLLNKVLTGKVVSAYPWIDEQDEGIRASAAPKDAETLFQLIHLFATAPRRDEAAFEAYRATLRERLRDLGSKPPQIFADAIAKKLWGDEPRRLSPTPEAVEQMDLDRALEFYRQRFADVSDFTFVFVGKIDLTSFRGLAERYLASLPGAGRKEAMHDLGLHRRQGPSQVRVSEGREDKASFTLIYHGESSWSENASTDLLSLEGYLTLRLRDVLRERLGGTYAPFVSANFERVPFDAYTFAIAFECKSAELDAIVKATRETIAELKKSGVTGRYVEALKNQRTRDLEQAYRSNGFWLDRLIDKYKLGEDPRDITKLNEFTPRINSDTLRLAARQFLRDDQVVEGRLTPAAAPASDAARAPQPTP